MEKSGRKWEGRVRNATREIIENGEGFGMQAWLGMGGYGIRFVKRWETG
jgi:hypothetical protein